MMVCIQALGRRPQSLSHTNPRLSLYAYKALSDSGTDKTTANWSSIIEQCEKQLPFSTQEHLLLYQ